MTDKTHDKELDALKAAIAGLREEIAGLAAGVKKSAGSHAEQSRAAAREEGPAHGEEGHGVLADLLHKFDSSRIQGEKVVRDLSAEVEQHPLVGIMAAFGLGYIIAKLWYQGNKQ
jgi:flagellar biosynthesis/type III secretory pathway protein FliH